MEKLIIDVKVTVESIDSRTYECCDCHLEFGSEQSLKKHILQSHYNFDPSIDKISKITYRFNCPVDGCRRNLKMDGEYFSSRKHLVQHFHKVS